MYYLLTYWDEKLNSPSTIEIEHNKLRKESIDAVSQMLPYIYDLYEEADEILKKGNIEKRYRIKYISKHSGGKRRIDIPDEELKAYMRKVTKVFSKKLNLVFPEYAYAYIKERNHKKMANAHIGNDIMLKTDIKDFFHSCTLEFILNSMLIVYPFCVMDISILETIVKACMIEIDGDYVLPQGAPSSPILSNIGMIPVDVWMNQILTEKYTYTRYADDLFLSRKKYRGTTWNSTVRIPKAIESDIFREINPKFKINKDKTYVVDISKTNGIWITGLMLNSNGAVTIGYKSKKILKATIFNFLMDAKNGKMRSKEEINHMTGIVGYWRYIEPEYVDMIIQKYEKKTGMNYHDEIVNICFK